MTQQDVTAVNVHFAYGGNKQLDVDVISRSGTNWIKVKSMNADAIQAIAEGRGAPKDKSIIEAAEEMLVAAAENIEYAEMSTCIVRFYNGVTKGIRADLEEMGIVVQDVTHFGIMDTDPYQIPYGDVINLDITTLICIVSELTNGGCDFEFQDSILAFQAKEERKSSIMIDLDKIMKGRTWIVTKTALNAFHTIIDLLGGKNERDRADKLLQKVKVVEDDPSEKILALGKKLEEKHRNVFGTGDKMKIVTVTGNHKMIHTLKNSGISIRVFIHGARALTETKMHEQINGKKMGRNGKKLD
jgi:hypothetical protein